jgi:hypothetical protein
MYTVGEEKKPSTLMKQWLVNSWEYCNSQQLGKREYKNLSVKGTMTRDFRHLVFIIKQLPL